MLSVVARPRPVRRVAVQLKLFAAPLVLFSVLMGLALVEFGQIFVVCNPCRRWVSPDELEASRSRVVDAPSRGKITCALPRATNPARFLQRFFPEGEGEVEGEEERVSVRVWVRVRVRVRVGVRVKVRVRARARVRVRVRVRVRNRGWG